MIDTLINATNSLHMDAPCLIMFGVAFITSLLITHILGGVGSR